MAIAPIMPAQSQFGTEIKKRRANAPMGQLATLPEGPVGVPQVGTPFTGNASPGPGQADLFSGQSGNPLLFPGTVFTPNEMGLMNQGAQAMPGIPSAQAGAEQAAQAAANQASAQSAAQQAASAQSAQAAANGAVSANPTWSGYNAQPATQAVAAVNKPPLTAWQKTQAKFNQRFAPVVPPPARAPTAWEKTQAKFRQRFGA